MRRPLRILGTVLVVAGSLTLVWAVVVWQWQDPFTALYTKWKQHQLSSQYDKRVHTFVGSVSGGSLAAERGSIAREAKAYRDDSARGEAIGRLHVPRMGLNMVLVNGTDHDTLKKGPGRDLRTFMPGQNRLVYIAGHRTTYLAPFSHIDRMRSGDRVTIDVPYGTFIYSVTRHRIVAATDLSVLRSPRYEVVELQACHPRFFASHRYIVYARLVRVEPHGAKAYDVSALAAQPSGR
ncbi:MAG: class E sortase [Actinobacteria bacterium]|nr:MAG: class E sortase [Actinomycetota bacterium]